MSRIKYIGEIRYDSEFSVNWNKRLVPISASIAAAKMRNFMEVYAAKMRNFMEDEEVYLVP